MKPKTTDKKITKLKTKEQHKEEHRDIGIDDVDYTLQATKRPGYVQRFAKGTPERIAKLQKRGWEFAEDTKDQVAQTEGSRVTAPLGRTKEGPNTQGFLMEIPEARYEALQELKAEPINALEGQMRVGKHEEKRGDNRYVPDGGIRIGRGR